METSIYIEIEGPLDEMSVATDILKALPGEEEESSLDIDSSFYPILRVALESDDGADGITKTIVKKLAESLSEQTRTKVTLRHRGANRHYAWDPTFGHVVTTIRVVP